MARIEARYQKDVLQALNFTGGFADFVKMVKADAQFYALTPEALLEVHLILFYPPPFSVEFAVCLWYNLLAVE